MDLALKMRVFILFAACCIVYSGESFAIDEYNFSQDIISKMEIMAEKEDDVFAQELLADHYYTVKDIASAIKWANKAVRQNSARGSLILALCCAEDSEDFNKNINSAAQIAFNEKNPYVASIIWKYYLKKNNMKDAFLLCKLAADYGYEDEIFFLPFFYMNGYGISTDYNRAYIYALVSKKMGRKASEEAISKLEDKYICKENLGTLKAQADDLKTLIASNKMNFDSKVKDDASSFVKRLQTIH